MTYEQIAELRRLAEAAKANLDQPYYSAKCVECGFELSYRHQYGCSVPEEDFKDKANPAAILELLDTLDRAVEMAKYYATELPWEESERKRYMWDDEETGAPVFLKEKVRSRLACHSMTKARDFLASLEGVVSE